MNFIQHQGKSVYMKVYPNGDKNKFFIVGCVIKYVGARYVIYTDPEGVQEFKVDKSKVVYIGESEPTI